MFSQGSQKDLTFVSSEYELAMTPMQLALGWLINGAQIGELP